MKWVVVCHSFYLFVYLLKGPRAREWNTEKLSSRKFEKKFEPRDANKLSHIVKLLSHLSGCFQLKNATNVFFVYNPLSAAETRGNDFMLWQQLYRELFYELSIMQNKAIYRICNFKPQSRKLQSPKVSTIPLDVLWTLTAHFDCEYRLWSSSSWSEKPF